MRAFRPIAIATSLLVLLAACDDAPSPTDPRPAQGTAGLTATPVAGSPAEAGKLITAGAPSAGEATPPPVAPQVQPARSDEALAVAVASPRGQVNGAVRPTITFNKPVRAIGQPPVDAQPPARISPNLPGEWRWLGSATLEFVPTAPAPRSTAFEVQVPAGLTALDGTRLDTAFSWRFETPRVSPLDGEPVDSWRAHRWVKPDQTFSVTFDHAPTRASLAKAITLRSPSGAVGISVGSITPLVAAEDRSTARSDARVQVEFTPVKPLLADTDYNLVFGPGLRSSEGSLATVKEERWAFRTYGPLRLKDVNCPRWHTPCALGPIEFAFSNPVTAAALAKAVRIDPPVKLRWPDDRTVSSDTWTVRGDFKPATRYRVRIQGLSDIFDQPLLAPYDGIYETGDMVPELRLPEGRALLEKGLRAALPMVHVNLPSLRVGWSRLTQAEAVRWLIDPERDGNPEAMHWAEQTVGGTRNALRRTPLDLASLFRPAGEGKAALIRTERPNPNPRSKRPLRTTTVVQVTDLGVHSKISPTNIFIWAWRLSDGSPAVGASVELLDRDGASLAKGVVGPGGVIELPGVDALAVPKTSAHGHRLYGPPVLVARVSLGEDVHLVRLDADWRLAPYRFGLNGGWENSAPEAEGLVFTDRGIYRPGETVYLKGALRERVLGKLVTPAGRTVTLEVRDPKNNLLQTTAHTLTRFGGFATEVRLPDEMVGSFDFIVKDASTKLEWRAWTRVVEYRAPSFLVEVTPSKTARFAGQPVSAGVSGRYLYGAAMAGAMVNWTLLARPGRFEPDAANGFVFGRRYHWWDDDGETEEIARGDWTLDTDGHFAFEGKAADVPPDRPRLYTLEASVEDVDRQQQSGRESFVVHPAAFYIGLKGPTGFAVENQAFHVDVLARAALDERRVEARQIKVKLVRHVWHTVKKKNRWGAFETISERQPQDVGEPCTISVGTDQPGQCVFTAAKAGFHEIVAEAVDAAGRRTITSDDLWVVGNGYAAWLKDDDHTVEVITDKGKYDVGDTVRVLVQSPFPQAEAWVSVEREGVLWQSRLQLKGTATPIEVPVTADMIPNAYISVVLARGRVAPPGTPGDPGRPAFRVGYRQIRVVPEAKRLDVILTPDSAEKRPGAELSVDVQVKDAYGKGVESEVAVWAVDAGVLALTGYQVPDPIAALYRPRRLSVRQANPLMGLVPQLSYGEKGSPAGGGGGEDDASMDDVRGMRRRFITTPLYFGTVTTDEQGRAQVRGRLPDNLTTFRLMAVAIDAGDRAGNGTSKVLLTKPLLARPALPRVVRLGDTFAAGVVVHAREAVKPTQVTVKARIDTAIKGLEPLSRTLTIPPDKGVEVRFAMKASQLGVGLLQFSVEGEGDSDLVEVPLAVTEPARIETVATYGTTDGTAVEKIAPPEGMRPDTGGLQVTLAASVLSGLGDAARDLLEYPHGCLEQESSRLVPFIALQRLLRQRNQPWLDERRPEEVVSSTIASIAALQRPDGGFGYWKSARRSHFWGSAFTVLAVHAADRAGYAVAPIKLDKAIKFLRQQLDSRNPSAEARAFALYVLARMGAAERGHMRRLFDQRERLAIFGQALLASALASDGDTARAQILLDSMLATAEVSPGTVRFKESAGDSYGSLFHTNGRTTAMALQALLAVQPDHVYVPRIARALLDNRRKGGGYRSTQEAAFTLLALADYAAAREPAQTEFAASARLGDQVLAQARFTSPGQPPVVRSTPASELPAAPTDLTFSAEGSGRLHYGARLRYAPKVMPTTPQDQGIVVQRWYTRPGKTERLRAVQAGDLVQVHLRIATHAARHYVAVEDPLPAGLESIDTSLATSSRVDARVEAAARHDGGRVYPWFSPFDNIEQRDDRVMLYADHLPPGVYRYAYQARATTAGTFVLPPARAEAMYRPEINGRSDGGTFWVHPKSVSAQAQPQPGQ